MESAERADDQHHLVPPVGFFNMRSLRYRFGGTTRAGRDTIATLRESDAKIDAGPSDGDRCRGGGSIGIDVIEKGAEQWPHCKAMSMQLNDTASTAEELAFVPWLTCVGHY